MKSSFLVLALFCTLLVIGLVIALNPEDIDLDHYCGVLPYPEVIPMIPRLGAEARALKLEANTFHTFFRHGDRATLSAKCFDGFAGFERIWNECPDPIYNYHMGLNFRRGDDEANVELPFRIPVQTHANKGVLKGNCHVGQLTNKGLMASYNNGNRVGKFLQQYYGKPITASMIQIRSTDVHRTRQTLQGFFTGISDYLTFETPQTSNFSPYKDSPALTFVEARVDALQLNDNVCNVKPYTEEAYKDPSFIDFFEKTYSPLEKELQALLHTNLDLYSIFDCMKTSYCHHIPVPKGLAEYSAKIEAALLTYWGQSYNYKPATANILYSGAFMAEFLPIIKEAMGEKKPAKEIYIWSGHDTTMQFLVHSWAIPDKKGFKDSWPAYSSLLNVELYKTADQKQYVRFVYDAAVTIPDWCKGSVVAKELCPLDKFVAQITKALPLNGECPDIPRQTLEKLEAIVESDPTPTGSPSRAGDDDINAFLHSMNQILAVQEAPEAQHDVEMKESELFQHLTSRY